MPGACHGLPHGLHGCTRQLVLCSSLASEELGQHRASMLCKIALCGLEVVCEPINTCQLPAA